MSGSNNNNLDLSKLGNDEPEKLAQQVEVFYKDDSLTKSDLSALWERNHLALDGKQWLVRQDNQRTGRAWGELTPSANNQYIPRPVTNLLYDQYQTLKSYLIQHKPRSSVRPKSFRSSDRMRAKMAELVVECNWERLKEAENYEHAAAVGITYGTVFKKDYWDTTSVVLATFPMEEPVMGPDGNPMLDETGQPVVQPVMDESGAPVMEEIPVGDVNTEVIEPFRMVLDPLATGLHDCRWVMETSIQHIENVIEQYNKEEEGYHPENVAELKPEAGLSESLRRYMTLKTTTGFRENFDGVSGGTDTLPENSVVVKEYYERPSLRHPKGRLVVVANGKCLYAHHSPYKGPELGDWHPYSEFRWELTAGRFWGIGPIDNGFELQKRVNSIDAATVLTRKTMAIPQRLIPKGSGIKKGEWTGRPGQNIEFRADVGTPVTVKGEGLDPSVIREREQVVQDMQSIMGGIDILKGDRPPGVTAASALEMLYEVGTGKLKPVLDRWKKFIESSQKKGLRLVANKYKEPRPEFVARLKAKNRYISETMIDNFIGEDLQDNCNVYIEAGSNVPKLQSVQKARLLEAAQTGALMLENPENRKNFLEQLGVEGFDEDVSPDVDRAERENDQLDEVGSPEFDPESAPIVFNFDEHELHKKLHERRMKRADFLDLPEEAQQAYLKHIEEHQGYIDDALQQQQLEAAAQGVMPGQGGAQDAQQGAKLSSAGDGIPSDTEDKLLQADMPPMG